MRDRAGRYHHGNLREALIEAGLSLLGEGGRESLSLREVARRAGVSHAAPYRHFEDRAALLTALAEHGYSELEVELARAGSSLAAIGRAYVRFALEHPARFRLMFERDHANLELAGRALAPLRAALAITRPSRDSELVAWAVMHGIATLGSEHWLQAEPAADVLAERAANLLVSALER